MKKQFQWKLSPKSEVFGVLGLCVTLFALVITFAFYMEFDPEAKQYKEQGTLERVEITALEPQAVGTLLNFSDEPIGETLIKRMENYPNIEVGATLHVYYWEENGDSLPESSVPQAPRDFQGIYVVFGFWFVALVFFWIDPRVLYIDYFAPHVQPRK